MTIFRGTFVDVPVDPFAGGMLRVDEAMSVENGVIVGRGAFDAVRGAAPSAEVVELTDGMVLPGFVDTHVHYPQVRAIGALGMPLLQWLDEYALPEEAKLADPTYAGQIATEFVSGLVSAGTTTALVFGAHFAPAVDLLFAEAARVGIRVTSGLVVSDRILREDLFTTPERAYEEGMALAQRWHLTGRNRYAVIPRFSLSCTGDLLDSCTALVKDVPQAWFTTHINENHAEIATVKELFDGSEHYLDSYARHDLVNSRSVFAHNVHPTDAELDLLAGHGAAIAHCPTSNSALGSGVFPLRRHLEHGVHVALGSDVGAGTGFSLFKEGLQAYFMQHLLGSDGVDLGSPHLLYLATLAGARALALDDEVGDFSLGKQFDAMWLRPREGSTLDLSLRHAHSPEDALAKVFAMGSPSDVRTVWVAGDEIRP